MREDFVKPLDHLIEQLLEIRQQLLQETQEYPVRIWGCGSDMVGSSCTDVRPSFFADYGEPADGAWSADQKYWGVCIKEAENANRT